MRPALCGALIASALLASAHSALAIQIELPPTTSSAPAPGAAPPPPSGTIAPATPARPTGITSALRIGARGHAVRNLQAHLRRRGARLAIDGAYGPATRRAVIDLQRRLRMSPSGIADRRLMRRLGLRAGDAVEALPVVPSPDSSSLLKAFPVAADHSYSDDWGARRAQGQHEGNDILAEPNVPVVAADDAIVERMTRIETGLGGIYVWLRRADGTEYYYAHLASIAQGLAAGSPVRAGEVIGANGNTGDARYGQTHVHFEIHPSGSGPTNPYPHLVAVDPDR